MELVNVLETTPNVLVVPRLGAVAATAASPSTDVSATSAMARTTRSLLGVRESARDCIRRSVKISGCRPQVCSCPCPSRMGAAAMKEPVRTGLDLLSRRVIEIFPSARQTRCSSAWQERRQSGLITNFPNPVCAVTHIACALQLAWDRKEAALANRGSEMGMAPFGAIRAKQTRNRRVALLT